MNIQIYGFKRFLAIIKYNKIELLNVIYLFFWQLKANQTLKIYKLDKV